jgi:hypothetical protein
MNPGTPADFIAARPLTKLKSDWGQTKNHLIETMVELSGS